MAELSTIARPYAEAVFASARETRLLGPGRPAVRAAELVSIDDVREALTDPRLNASKRIELSRSGQVPLSIPLATSSLADRNHAFWIAQIAEQFEQLKNELEGTALAEIPVHSRSATNKSSSSLPGSRKSSASSSSRSSP